MQQLPQECETARSLAPGVDHRADERSPRVPPTLHVTNEFGRWILGGEFYRIA